MAQAFATCTIISPNRRVLSHVGGNGVGAERFGLVREALELGPIEKSLLQDARIRA